jgi:hypothetical protein
MTQALPSSSARVGEFLKKMRTARGRLIFGLDATMSREWAWDASVQLQAEMFAEAGKIGGLEMQLVFFRGLAECKASHWTTDTRELAAAMSRIRCEAGLTQIGRILAHARREHERQRVNALIFVGDAVEEKPHDLFDIAAGLGAPLFLLQEGNDAAVERTFAQIANLTNGAHLKFASGSLHEFGELLRAIAAFSVGGVTALADLRTAGAAKLLGQLK